MIGKQSDGSPMYLPDAAHSEQAVEAESAAAYRRWAWSRKASISSTTPQSIRCRCCTSKFPWVQENRCEQYWGWCWSDGCCLHRSECTQIEEGEFPLLHIFHHALFSSSSELSPGLATVAKVNAFLHEFLLERQGYFCSCGMEDDLLFLLIVGFSDH